MGTDDPENSFTGTQFPGKTRAKSRGLRGMWHRHIYQYKLKINCRKYEKSKVILVKCEYSSA